MDERLTPWYDALPEADTRAARVRAVIDRLSQATNPAGDNALELLLRVLSENTPEGDALRDDLAALAHETAQALADGLRATIAATQEQLAANPVTAALAEQMVAPLRLQLDAVEARIAAQRQTMVGRDQTTITGSANIIGNGSTALYVNQLNVYQGERPNAEIYPDPDEALRCYLIHVIEQNSRLQLQGIRSASGLVSIELEEVYVTLTATVRRTVADEDAWLEEMAKRAPGEKPDRSSRPVRFGDRSMVETVKVQVQEALALHPRLVVLGDPGSGKTTLLRYLALTFARDFPPSVPPEGGEAVSPPSGGIKGGRAWVKQRLNLDERRLPILLPLRDFARYLEKECPDVGADGPKLLLDYLRLYFTNQNLALPPDFFEARLKAGDCLALFDGVDEVASMTTRQRIARILEKFTLAYSQNRYVVTSRIVGYTAGARLGADYATTTVRDFTDDDIARFARHWNRAVEIVLAGGPTEYALRKAEAEADKLIQAVKTNARVRELAVNPLLLTVIALVQRYRAQLPDRRVELYEEALEVLLAQWDAVKGLPATEVLQGLELDAGDRRSMLEPVALWLMEQRLREIELDDLRDQLKQPFQAMLKDWRQANKAVDGFIALINARSGLLTERGQGIYAFSHLTFQEHLAARCRNIGGGRDKPPPVKCA